MALTLCDQTCRIELSDVKEVEERLGELEVQRARRRVLLLLRLVVQLVILVILRRQRGWDGVSLGEGVKAKPRIVLRKSREQRTFPHLLTRGPQESRLGLVEDIFAVGHLHDQRAEENFRFLPAVADAVRGGGDHGEELVRLALLGLRHSADEVLGLAEDVEGIRVRRVLRECARPPRLQTEQPPTERLSALYARAGGDVAPERLRRPDERAEATACGGRRPDGLQLHVLEDLGEERLRQQREAGGLRPFLEALLVLAALLLLALLGGAATSVGLLLGDLGA